MKMLYETTVRVTGGRDGRATSDDGRLAVTLALPAAIGGSGEGSNPEQLFAAGLAACFDSSLRFAARSQGLDAGDVSVAATVGLTLSDAGTYGLAAALDVTLPGLDPADRAVVVAEAERLCAYTNATRGNVAITVRLG